MFVDILLVYVNGRGVPYDHIKSESGNVELIYGPNHPKPVEQQQRETRVLLNTHRKRRCSLANNTAELSWAWEISG